MAQAAVEFHVLECAQSMLRDTMGINTRTAAEASVMMNSEERLKISISEKLAMQQ